MTIGIVFWIIMIVWLVLAVYVRFAPSPPAVTWPWPFDPVVYILLVLLGVGIFGWPIKT